MKTTKTQGRLRRHARVRSTISGTADMPRISIYRSNKYIFVQAINDLTNTTLLGMTTKKTKGTKSESSFVLGSAMGKELSAKGITKAVFDRGGFRYHGRVAKVAEGLRAAGIKI
jgi:large subunit ribosomal protein L18